MRLTNLLLPFALAGCVAAAPAPAPAPPPAPTAALPAPPLVLTDADFGFGTTVVLGRLPDARDLDSFHHITSLSRVVLDLPAWPAGWDRLQAMAQVALPEGAEYLVILPGYPPTRAAADAWNQVRLPVRLVVVVSGPPSDRAAIAELNSIRALDRVVADMADPVRAGFERLQRPLSFRVVRR